MIFLSNGYKTHQKKDYCIQARRSSKNQMTTNPEKISAMILMEMKGIARVFFGTKAKKYSNTKNCKEQPREIWDQCEKKSMKPVYAMQDRLICTYEPEETCRDEEKQYCHKVEKDALEEVCKQDKSTKNDGYGPKVMVYSRRPT